VTWWRGWDSLIESAKGWADPYIADAYILFGRADSNIWFIWFGIIGCLVLLLVFEIIERNARRKKQRNVADATASKQRRVGGRRRSNQQNQFQTKKSRST
jgi:hypothetical protein